MLKHVYICGKQSTNNCVHVFLNVTQLTIKHYFRTSGHSIWKTLNGILPIKQVTKLVIQYYHFPFEQIVKSLRFTSNLNTWKLDLLSFNKTNLRLIQQTETVQYVSKKK